ncbi:Acyltransferase family protein [Nitrosospira multiformis]|uniref:Acyltransferase family protein n=1 Tax=Nitrosospira multiformis TaxID=1231 RepID=A0A1H8FGZ3_9PROT|nr:Acyltransferase family protein [Nitrosospira multiformis]
MDLPPLLKRDANSLDLFRIIAACMVIYGHAYVLTPEIGRQDWLKTHVGFDHVASLAVKIFFFIGGLVVTNI